MNGCDRADQNLGYYGVQDRRSTKWWKKLYFWAIEIGQLNAFILYKIQNNAPQKPGGKQFTFKGFKDAIVQGLVSKYAAETGLGDNILAPPEPGMALPGRPRDQSVLDRHTSKQHLVVFTQNDRRCK
ncbi:PiggyBac transposable element-derived protein 4 [Plakobranchus ocellatus]|uniref:PiggyBac transposable element-derived protein 4 n=1 Tax=Plakobranchus ocellatus TaxID=259542 RepID=A0AAV4B2X1_9GAST|nr:PiggyBac transposable element-derived protein 4 [Plakobranchus ocellatus]